MKHCWHNLKDFIEYMFKDTYSIVKCCHCAQVRAATVLGRLENHGEFAPMQSLPNPDLDEECPRRPV